VNTHGLPRTLAHLFPQVSLRISLASNQQYYAYKRVVAHTLIVAAEPMARDTADLWPGEDWHIKIRHAITDNSLVFIACFSRYSASRVRSRQNEVLALAVDQLRMRRPDVPWLIPVRFDDCSVPDYDLGGGRTLASIQAADLFGNGWDVSLRRLLTTIWRLLEQNNPAHEAN
jgi:hypothetical protein